MERRHGEYPRHYEFALTPADTNLPGTTTIGLLALKKAKPGTPEFRAAMRDSLETMGRTVFAHGVMNWTPADHWGYTLETGVMTKVVDGKFKVE